MSGRRTDFADLDATDFEAPAVRMVETSPAGPRHVFVPSVTRLRDGTLLATCRFDAVGCAEGDDTNEQALLCSDDGGLTWSGGDRPIVTLARGTSFSRPSAITHSLVFADDAGRVWLYWSINQPYTWGPGRPDRSTGGGEVRRVRLVRDSGGWRTDGPGTVAWGFRAPVGDGRGGTLDDVRIALEDKAVRTAAGTLLLAVSGRSTVDDPHGAYWRLNRCWVLESVDAGQTWSAAHLIGGSDSIALTEPTIEVAADGTLVCLMRAQYGTGRELYRSLSRDHGRTWTPPEPTGLPNAGEFGTKPFLRRIAADRYALLVFSEPGDAGRTGASVYLTDSPGLLDNRWPGKRTLLIESPGTGDAPAYGVGGYGWLAPLGDGGLIAVLATQHGGSSRITAVRADRDWLDGPAIEPIGVRDDAGDDRPTLADRAGRAVLRFPSARSRGRDCGFAALDGFPRHVVIEAVVDRAPEHARFDLCRLDAMHGRHPWLVAALLPGRSPTVWLRDAHGWRDTGYEPRPGEVFELAVDVLDAHRAAVRLDGVSVGGAPVLGASSTAPDLLTVGGEGGPADRCAIDLLAVDYRAPTVRQGWASGRAAGPGTRRGTAEETGPGTRGGGE